MEFITYTLSLIGFCVAAFLAFYIPGRVLLGKTKQFSPFLLHTISLSIGIVLFAWQGYFVGTLHVRWVTYVYIFLFFVVYVVKKYYPKRFTFPVRKIDVPSALLIGLGVFAQTISYVRMGWRTSQGLIVLAHNDADHIWHASLVHELITRFPPHDPAIAGVELKDYHFWFNLVTADIIRIFHLPLFPTQFIGMYVLGSMLLGFLVYSIAGTIYSSKLFVRLCLFFLFFGGNAAGWYMLATSRVFDWNISSLIVDGTKFMDSPAYGYAIIIGLTGIFFLLQKKLSWMHVLLSGLCFGSLLEFKVYVGITFFVGLGCFTLYSLFRKNFKTVIVGIVSVIFGLIIFLPAITPGGGLAFIPFDIPRDFINQVKIGHVDWQLRWVIFQDHHNTFRIIQYGLMMSGVYFLIQYGVLLLGLIPLSKTRKTFGSILLFMYPTIMMGLVMGLLFYQRVGGANIWEFFLAGVPFLGLLVAGNMVAVLENKKRILQCVLIILIVLFTIPQWILSLTSYIHDEFFTPFHGISQAELTSYAYLKNNTPKKSVILVLGQQKYVGYSSDVSIFVDRDLYLSGEGVRQKKTPVIIHREYIIGTTISLSNPEEIAKLLSAEHIAYIYVFNNVYPGIYGDKTHLVQQFTNKVATIYKIN